MDFTNSASTTTAAGVGYSNPSLSSSSHAGISRQPGLLSIQKPPRRGHGRGRGRGGHAAFGGSAYGGQRNEDNLGNGGIGFEPLTRGAPHSEDGQTVMCNCGMEAVQRTVQKDGPNKGKQFFTCSKPREEQCGFFEWADNVPSCYVKQTTRGTLSRARGRGRGRGRGRTTSNNAEEDFGTHDESSGRKKRAPPTCSLCRQQGHTKRSCPQAKQLS